MGQQGASQPLPRAQDLLISANKERESTIMEKHYALYWSEEDATEEDAYMAELEVYQQNAKFAGTGEPYRWVLYESLFSASDVGYFQAEYSSQY